MITVAETTNGFPSAACEVLAAAKAMKHTAAVRHSRSVKTIESFRTVILPVLIAVFSACHEQTKSDKADDSGSMDVTVPEHGAYTGAFIDFGEAEEDVTLEGIE